MPVVAFQLIRALDDEDNGVRRSAAEALGNIGTIEASQALIGALDDSKLEVRVEVVDALGKIGAEDAIKPLIRLAKKDNFDLIIDSLEKLFLKFKENKRLKKLFEIEGMHYEFEG